MYGFGHWYRVAMLVVTGATLTTYGWVGTLVIPGSATPDGELAFLGWLVSGFILAFNLYLWLVRRPYRLELVGDAIRWDAVLRRGELRVRMLRAIELEPWLIRPWMHRGIYFRPFGAPPLILRRHSNLALFTESLLQVSPKIEVWPRQLAYGLGIPMPPER